MAEQRWKDPAGNEWVTIETPSPDIFSGYPDGTIEIPMVPIIPPVIDPIPESVTARQFKMQLVISGLKAAVDAWVAAQEDVVQVAYEYSGNFVRTEPMMQAGFTALGFTEDQRNAFFLAASKL